MADDAANDPDPNSASSNTPSATTSAATARGVTETIETAEDAANDPGASRSFPAQSPAGSNIGNGGAQQATAANTTLQATQSSGPTSDTSISVRPCHSSQLQLADALA